jgi:LysM repeat protein
MDWKSLLRNRKVQIGGLAVAAGAGAFAFYRKRAAGGASSTDAAAAGDGSTGGAAYTPGAFPDTSGTDVAGFLGQYSQQLQTELDQGLAAYTQQQTDFLAALGHQGVPAPNPTPGGGTPAPKPKPGGTPKPTPTPKPAASYVTVTKFSSSNPSWSSTLSGIASHEKTTVAQLLKLNPSIKNANVIQTGQKIRYR